MSKIINSFPGYSFENGNNLYRGEDVGKGGYVYAEPGMYWNVALLDAASMHPSSIISMDYFGEHTKRYKELLDLRLAIKHQEFDKARHMLDGKLEKYLQDEARANDLSKAIKLPLNQCYGLTSANFNNPFRHPDNLNNIVALKGALFMVNLKHEVQERGFTVAHIKTDSIKIPNATPEIIKFVQDYGLKYGYTMEHEATYEKMCLVNDAVYIAKYKDGGWTATGAQFQVPYVFKTLFSREPIEFSDMCETKSVTSALYLDMNEELPDVSEYEKERDKLWKQITDESKLNTPMDEECKRVEELTNLIEKGHDYVFIGRVGQFCPIKPGHGGGVLCREATDPKTGEKKYVSATGAKGYRWLESEMVRVLGKEDSIDRSYYDELVNDAVDEISKYGDFERFVADDSEENDTPPWFNPDEPYIDEQETTPFDVR